MQSVIGVHGAKMEPHAPLDAPYTVTATRSGVTDGERRCRRVLLIGTSTFTDVRPVDVLEVFE